MAASSSSFSPSQSLISRSIPNNHGSTQQHSDRLALPGINLSSISATRTLSHASRAVIPTRRVGLRASVRASAVAETLEKTDTALVEKSVNTIRFLAIDAVEKANSGHPGLPMGCAPMGHVLYDEVMRYNPKNPYWFNRDRFVLSAGHGCMLQYALLHLAGYDSVKVKRIYCECKKKQVFLRFNFYGYFVLNIEYCCMSLY